MMKRRRRRKCLHCSELFRPDPRNVSHQKYCSKAQCRKASKAASQRRWLNKKENKNHFRGPENVLRVQTWRQAHPGYWRRNGSLSEPALQDDLLTQPIDSNKQSDILKPSALQDLLANQGPVLIGLIAHLSGSALQDDIADMGQRLIGLGGEILNLEGGQHVHQTCVTPGADTPDSRSV